MRSKPSSCLYAAGVSGLVRSQGSVTITLPCGIVILNPTWPSQRTSVRAATGGAVGGGDTGGAEQAPASVASAKASARRINGIGLSIGASLRLDVARFHDRGPAHDLAPDQVAEFLWAGARRRRAFDRELLGD